MATAADPEAERHRRVGNPAEDHLRLILRLLAHGDARELPATALGHHRYSRNSHHLYDRELRAESPISQSSHNAIVRHRIELAGQHEKRESAQISEPQRLASGERMRGR